MSSKMKNYGMLLMDYFNGDVDAEQVLKRDDGKLIHIPIKTYFRSPNELMPGERNFHQYCQGKILCIGGGTGVHGLILQEMNFDVETIDISEEACTIMKERGLKKVRCLDFYKLGEAEYDTVLLLGRNIGIVETLDKLEGFLLRMKSFLKKDGRILLNSFDLKFSNEVDDIIYMQNNEKSGRYYGEVRYCTVYREIEGELFHWLYLDYNTLREYANKVGLYCEILEKDENGNYMAMLMK